MQIEGNRNPINVNHGAAVGTTLTVKPHEAICTVAGVTIFGAADDVAAARAALEATPLPSYPDELTPELREVLGWPNFRCAPVAHLLQAAGYPIPRSSEDEQAHVLHWFTRLALRHGTHWRNAVREEISAIHERLKAERALEGSNNG
ncbi:hypothetical protein AB3X91_24495 [Paraburkholderia sp. BR14263]|uniref:hypothetical protein n=1 Tax=unclassified Paraburkholderia TaxID=2615204 RepID=UPI0034CDE626